MREPRLLTVGVECYAGRRGEQMPRTMILGDRRIGVAEVLDAWLGADYRYFKLKGADGDTYRVRHDERSNTWELTMFRAEHVADHDHNVSAPRQKSRPPDRPFFKGTKRGHAWSPSE